jgi:hypothetical protein
VDGQVNGGHEGSLGDELSDKSIIRVWLRLVDI